ncbi:MAG: prolipoprotein diacylglyceryl transferase [Patescibacteria group bacterium]
MDWWHTFSPSAVAFQLGFFTLSWYGIIIAGAVLAALAVARFWFVRRGVSLDYMYGLLFWLLVFGVIGGRIGHIIGEWSYYSSNPGAIPALWRGGIAIQGVLIADILTLWWYTRRHRLAFWGIADILAVAAPLAQAIGRWGNYFNQELYGGPTDVAWAIPIEPAYRLSGYAAATHFHPLFLYESLLMLELFIVMYVLYCKQALRPGEYTLLYFMLFPVVRFSLDFLRIDMLAVGPLLLSQWISIAFIIGAIGLWWYRRSRRKG